MKSPYCRLGTFQFAPVLRQRETNANRIVAAGTAAAQAGVDLLVTPEQILPPGDLYASEVEAIPGRCSVPAEADRLVELAGGFAALDRLLYALWDERRETEAVMAALPSDQAREVLDALAAARFARRRLGLVPKLGRHTLGIDFFA